MSNFSEKIKQYRSENKITQEEFASKLNVSRQAVSKWETGVSYPNYEILSEIAKLLNTSVDSLLSKEEIIKETVATKSKGKRNLILIIIISIISTLAVLLGTIGLLLAISNGKQEQSNPEPQDTYLGCFLMIRTINEDGYFKEEPTVEEFQALKYPGYYDTGNGYKGLFRNSNSTHLYFIDNEETIETEFTFIKEGIIGYYLAFQKIDSKEIYFEWNVIGQMGDGSQISFSEAYKEKIYHYRFTIKVAANATTTTVKEYGNDFQLIKETKVDYEHIPESITVSNECLYVIIEDIIDGKLYKQILWRENLPKSFTVYHTEDTVQSTNIQLKIE